MPADRPVHSLHAYFIRPGDPSIPIVYIVDRVRDGRSFTTRRVSAIQHGKTIFTLSASFHHPEPGIQHAMRPCPPVPPPDDRVAQLADERIPAPANPIDLRFVGPSRVDSGGQRIADTEHNLVWLRANGELPDDPLLHVCLMTYASDLTLLDSVLRGTGCPGSMGRPAGPASITRCGFTGRSARTDWLLYDQESPTAAGARGLAWGHVFTDEGELVVSVVQEGLVRTMARAGGAS